MSGRTRSRTYSQLAHTPRDANGLLPIMGYVRTYRPGIPGETFTYHRFTPDAMNSSVDTCSDFTHYRVGRRWSGGDRLGVYHDTYNYDVVGASSKGVKWGTVGGYLADFDGLHQALLGKWCWGNHGTGLNRITASANGTESYGARAWNKFKPGKPNGGLSVFLAEIRDLPRMLRDTNDALRKIWKAKRVPTPKDLGGDYITYMFGWAPFVSDMKKFLDLYRNFDKRVADLRRLNGQWIKRTGSVAGKEEQIGSVWTDPSGYWFHPLYHSGALIPGSYGSSGVTMYSERIWFSGRFRYYLPPSDMIGKPSPDLMRRMAGLTLTPQVVWELIPWSWFIDYFLHVEDLLANLDNGVVSECAAQYAYLMNTSQVSSVQQSFASFKNGGSITGSASRISVTKTRVPASPFGFGLSGDLTPGQLGILAGLGLARS